MKYAIIAAGVGSRLSHEGIDVPKPLVQVGGESLINRLIRIFLDHEAEEILVICNEEMVGVQAHLHDLIRNGFHGVRVPLRIVVKQTPSSMHSLYAISPWLSDSPFCLTTVDTIFAEEAFGNYVRTFRQAMDNGVDALMGVTSYVDDEKPLYVTVDDNLNVSGFYDEKPDDCRFVSAGVYGFRPCVLKTLQRCIERGEHRMRAFQRALVSAHLNVKAYDMGQVLDVDHASDIVKAETFLKHHSRIQNQTK